LPMLDYDCVEAAVTVEERVPDISGSSCS
jgi:hypothetical protein